MIKKLGIIGGGQLGRMMANAASELGILVYIFTPEENSPASQVAHKTVFADYSNTEELLKFANEVDIITFEFENIPYESLELLEKTKPVYPSANILKISRNRVREKSFINEIGLETAEFRPVTNLEELQTATTELGLPAILKTSELGYDGKGQIVIKPEDDLQLVWKNLGSNDAILEKFVDFQMELSVIVARYREEARSFVAVQNIHKNHILDITIAPAPIGQELAKEAEIIATKIAEKLDLRGLLAVEMFLTRDNKILVNELAPRPHNSGHWTMDACLTSQFEQAIRAVCGLPLGNEGRFCNASMKNLIGNDVLDAEKYLKMENAKLHLYGKSEVREGRKMGHVTILDLEEE